MWVSNSGSAEKISIVTKIWNKKQGITLQTPVFFFSYFTLNIPNYLVSFFQWTQHHSFFGN